MLDGTRPTPLMPVGPDMVKTNLLLVSIGGQVLTINLSLQDARLI